MNKFPRFVQAFQSVAAATETQLAGHYYDGDRAAARAGICKALAEGFITAEMHLIRPRHTPGPIAVFSAGDPMPCPEHLAYVAEKRWSASLEPELVIRGTYKLAAYCGGHHGVIPSAHLSHEVALSSIFFAKQKADPSFRWTLVFQSGPRGVRVDAISGDGTLVEMVGRYAGAKLAQKLALAATGASLELW